MDILSKVTGLITTDNAAISGSELAISMWSQTGSLRIGSGSVISHRLNMFQYDTTQTHGHQFQQKVGVTGSFEVSGAIYQMSSSTQYGVISNDQNNVYFYSYGLHAYMGTGTAMKNFVLVGGGLSTAYADVSGNFNVNKRFGVGKQVSPDAGQPEILLSGSVFLSGTLAVTTGSYAAATILWPSASDIVPLWKTETALTVKELWYMPQGSGSVSASVRFNASMSVPLRGTDIDLVTVCSNTASGHNATLRNTAIPSGSWVYMVVSGSPVGNIMSLGTTLRFY